MTKHIWEGWTVQDFVDALGRFNAGGFAHLDSAAAEAFLKNPDL